ncbi:hypothetical protein [Arthrobacter sp. A5]|uniref:hypothetical protein n=1 Tax=Arthrobacter sp. A5 TaxID=576926 RepID=UPI003DA9B564
MTENPDPRAPDGSEQEPSEHARARDSPAVDFSRSIDPDIVEPDEDAAPDS